MAFPNDLSDVVVFKIHPAIGIARLSVSDAYFAFGPEPDDYKSNGLMKGQAVQFRIFAYGQNHQGLGELTPEVMAALKITAVWSANVANRKVARRATGMGAPDPNLVIVAAASSDVKQGQLTGKLSSFKDKDVPLGRITSDGLFIPPQAGVFRQKGDEAVPDYPGSESVSDNSCDGSVSVTLAKDGKALTKDGKTLDVLPACIVVCAHDFSPDVDPPAGPDTNLFDYLRDKLQIPSDTPKGNLHNQAAQALDEAALRPGTARYAPGVEVSLGEDTEIIDVKSIFYQSSQDPRIDPREMRVRYKSAPTDPGAVPGQLTSGLCSPWQSDYSLCISFWTEHLPPDVYADESATTTIKLFRKISSDMSSGAETLYNDPTGVVQIDKAGVARLRMGSGRLLETERLPSPAGDITAPPPAAPVVAQQPAAAGAQKPKA